MNLYNSNIEYVMVYDNKIGSIYNSCCTLMGCTGILTVQQCVPCPVHTNSLP